MRDQDTTSLAALIARSATIIDRCFRLANRIDWRQFATDPDYGDHLIGELYPDDAIRRETGSERQAGHAGAGMPVIGLYNQWPHGV